MSDLNNYLSNYLGIEFEEDPYYFVDNDQDARDYNQVRQEIVLQKEQYAIDFIIRMIDTQFLDLSPEFQRNEVWSDNKKKSLFIESLLLNIPVPIFYAYSNQDEQLSIIDGKQRLSTIRDFYRGKFKLTNLHHLKQFNGFVYNELPDRVKNNLDRYQCYFYILNYLTPKRYIFDIFMRINTGSVPLTSQEIRNIFAKPRVRNLLKDMASSVSFRKATRQKIKDIRMDAQELALRFIALKNNYDFKNHRFIFPENNLSELLDRVIAELNAASDAMLKSYLVDFKDACEQAYELLGDYAFSRLKMQGNSIKLRSNTINKSLFSAFTVLLSDEKYKYKKLREYRNKVLFEFCIVQSEPTMNAVLSSGTGSKSNLGTIFNCIEIVLEDFVK